MKKIILLLSPLVIWIGISSCNSSGNEAAAAAGTDSLQTLLNRMRDSIKRFPDEPRLKFNLAVVLQDAGRYKDALAALDSMNIKGPSEENPFVYLNYLFKKSELEEATGDTAAAIHSLETLVQPGEISQASLRLANLYAATKNPHTLTLCDLMIRNDSFQRSPEPFYFKGAYYDNTGNEAMALKEFDNSIKRDYNFIDAYLEKGRILYESKKYAEARKVFELAQTINNSFADTYFWIGKCQEALGQKEEAKLNYKRAYGLDKSLTEARDAAERMK